MFSARKSAKFQGGNQTINLAQLLEESVERYADRPVLIADGRRVTYTQLNDAVNATMDRLLHLGLKQGDKVGVGVGSHHTSPCS